MKSLEILDQSTDSRFLQSPIIASSIDHDRRSRDRYRSRSQPIRAALCYAYDDHATVMILLYGYSFPTIARRLVLEESVFVLIRLTFCLRLLSSSF